MARRGWDSFLAEHNRMIYPHNNNAWETLGGHHQKLRAAMPNSISFTLFRPFLFKNLKKIYIFKLLVFGVVFECQCYFFHEISFSFQFCCRRLDAQKIAHYFLSLSNLEHFPADVPLWHLFLCGYFIVRLFLYECHVSLCSTKGLCPLSSNFSFSTRGENVYRSQVEHQPLDDWVGENCVCVWHAV